MIRDQQVAEKLRRSPSTVLRTNGEVFEDFPFLLRHRSIPNLFQHSCCRMAKISFGGELQWFRGFDLPREHDASRGLEYSWPKRSR
jgi:hypothetical protein